MYKSRRPDNGNSQACMGYAAYCNDAVFGRCRCGEIYRLRIFFGLSMPDGGAVSLQAWQASSGIKLPRHSMALILWARPGTTREHRSGPRSSAHHRAKRHAESQGTSQGICQTIPSGVGDDRERPGVRMGFRHVGRLNTSKLMLIKRIV